MTLFPFIFILQEKTFSDEKFLIKSAFPYIQQHCTAAHNIRPFTVGRKNRLFSASSKGAEAGACVYSIIKACKANNIDSEKYLIYLSTRMPNEERLKGEKILEKIHALEPCSAKILQIT